MGVTGTPGIPVLNNTADERETGCTSCGSDWPMLDSELRLVDTVHYVMLVQYTVSSFVLQMSFEFLPEHALVKATHTATQLAPHTGMSTTVQ